MVGTVSGTLSGGRRACEHLGHTGEALADAGDGASRGGDDRDADFIMEKKCDVGCVAVQDIRHRAADACEIRRGCS
jgi:hypothetical protein